MADEAQRQSCYQQLPWTDRLLLSLFSALRDATRLPGGTVFSRLISFFESRCSANSAPISGVRTSDLTVDPSRNLWIRVFAPSDTQKSEQKAIPVIVYFHGGGFCFLSASSRPFDLLCRRMCREIGVLVVSVNYRLAPESKCPAPYDDGMDVLRFIDSGGIEFESMGILSGLELDLGNCFLAGDSAGGNIVHHVARRWAASSQRWDKIHLAGVISIQPFFGGEERTESELRLKGAPLISIERSDWAWKAFLPDRSDRNHEAANVFDSIEKGIEERFPPLMVVVGGFDPHQDRQRRYYESLKGRGKKVRLVEYPDAFHGFYVFPKLKESGLLIEEMKGFVDAYRSNIYID